MRKFSIGAIIVSLVWTTLTVRAADEVINAEILAQRGKGQVSQKDFAARVDRIPENIRPATLRDRNRVRDLINTLLLRAQLVADAREAGYDKEGLVMHRMKLAADAELAEAWVQHYVDIQPQADYERLAYEAYQLNRQNMQSAEKIDVSHILVSTKERTDEEAKTLAESLQQQLMVDPSRFEELVNAHSDDPSAASNHGSFKSVEKGDMVKAFEEVAFAMEVGKISRPVKTSYGYHIIRLDAHTAPEEMSFEAVKEQLIEREKKAHNERIKRDYLSGLSSLNVDMTKEALEEMVRSQFGEEVFDPEANSENSE